MKYITSTLYNWLDNDSGIRSQLHIYAVESEEEYLELSAMIDESRGGEILEYLGYYSDKIPAECVAGSEFTVYSCVLCGNFLVVEESAIIDV